MFHTSNIEIHLNKYWPIFDTDRIHFIYLQVPIILIINLTKNIVMYVEIQFMNKKYLVFQSLFAKRK